MAAWLRRLPRARWRQIRGSGGGGVMCEAVRVGVKAGVCGVPKAGAGSYLLAPA